MKSWNTPPGFEGAAAVSAAARARSGGAVPVPVSGAKQNVSGCVRRPLLVPVKATGIPLGHIRNAMILVRTKRSPVAANVEAQIQEHHGGMRVRCMRSDTIGDADIASAHQCARTDSPTQRFTHRLSKKDMAAMPVLHGDNLDAGSAGDCWMYHAAHRPGSL
jgi:hypothetical protein